MRAGTAHVLQYGVLVECYVNNLQVSALFFFILCTSEKDFCGSYILIIGDDRNIDRQISNLLIFISDLFLRAANISTA